MTLAVRAVSEVASDMALLPFAWLAWRNSRGSLSDAAFWWLAGAFSVSWLADTAAHWVDPWFVSAVYPVSQAALVGAVLLDRGEARLLLAVITLAALVGIAWEGVTGPGVFLRTVAWGAAAGIAYDFRALGRLRVALVVSFGLGLLCWWGYAAWPGWWSWGTYQTVRLAGLLLFCWASTSPGPHLRLSRRP